jgi:membrane protein YqaA with SNARE-associated domain
VDHLLIYIGLFAVSFIAATVLPAQTEAALFGLLVSGTYPTWALLLVASFGNVIGSCVNWLLGVGLSRFEHHRLFPIRRDTLSKAEEWYHSFGRYSLLLSWLPIIGDPLTVVAGALREPFLIFLLLVTVAKVGRYLAVVAIYQGWFA